VTDAAHNQPESEYKPLRFIDPTDDAHLYDLQASDLTATGKFTKFCQTFLNDPMQVYIEANKKTQMFRRIDEMITRSKTEASTAATADALEALPPFDGRLVPSQLKTRPSPNNQPVPKHTIALPCKTTTLVPKASQKQRSPRPPLRTRRRQSSQVDGSENSSCCYSRLWIRFGSIQVPSIQCEHGVAQHGMSLVFWEGHQRGLPQPLSSRHCSPTRNPCSFGVGSKLLFSTQLHHSRNRRWAG